ncbi:MAG: hydroxylase [Alphaproteobacteria bacterium]|nr:hydroxylase [Alphaproteobacteria bacterium]
MSISERQHASKAYDTIEAARRLVPTVARRAPEIESARRIPHDLLGELVAAGCFRILTPTSHGGLGADLPTGMRMFETLARADASVAWTVMMGGASWIDLVGLPRATFDELFASRPNVTFAGVFSPSGSIKAIEGGYKVTGRWSFASGCEDADWLFGNNVEKIEGDVPHLRMAVFTPDQVVVEDTWNVSGLSGTGSHHFHVDDVFVPSARTLVPLSDEPCIDAVIARVPPPAMLSLNIGSVAVGIGQGALDDIVALATGKIPLLAESTLARNAHFQFELASADATLRAARALLYESAESLWASATSGSPLSLDDRARIRSAAVWATNRATEVVTSAYRAGGGSSVYASSPLQRRLRDVNALTQHFLVRNDTLTTAGAILAGQDVSVMVF